MAGHDVFISYASVDRSCVAELAEALEELGWEVFWDPVILPGETYVKVIEQHLDTVHAVVVVWSPASRESPWVLDEARRAAERKVLVPATIEGVLPPMGFGNIQAADLTGWTGDSSHDGFAQLVAGIGRLAGPRQGDVPSRTLPRRSAPTDPELDEGAGPDERAKATFLEALSRRWAIVAAIVAAGLVASVVALVTIGGSGTGPLDDTMIAFTSTSTDNPEIYVMNADGSGRTQLTRSPGADHEPTWSPDGTRIAFSSNWDHEYHEIYVMDGDGADVTRLTQSPAHDDSPTWSPGGTMIAFNSSRDGNIEIYRMDANGANPTRLTDNPGDDFNPAWSPDGTKIVFASTRDGGTSIYVMDVGGTNLVRLTSGSNDRGPSWSPDGTMIAFHSDRAGNDEIYTIDANGANPTRLTDNPGDDLYPAWSPDGTKIAFQSTRDGNAELYVMDANGISPTRLTRNPTPDSWPAWSPFSG